MKIELISVGSELVCGETRDLNAPFAAKKLTEMGFDVVNQTIAGDNSEELKFSLQAASERANLIIMTGGLGPTKDDITREVIADFCNVALVPDEKSINHIEDLIGNTHNQNYVNHLKQAKIPEGSIIIQNATGTAQGFLVTTAQTNIICLPGVHTEMVQMFENWIVPYIQRKSGQSRKRYTRVINTFGMSESILDEKVERIIKSDKYLSYSTLVNDGIVSIHIILRDMDEIEAVSILDNIEEEICNELGEFVFSKSEETLENIISNILKKNAITLAVAESCTGGLVSNLLTNIQGSSAFFLGGIVSYSNKIKKNLLNVSEKLITEYGVISAEAAKAMAAGARERMQADIGLAVTGIAGPTGIEEGIDQTKPVGLVYVATAINDDLECKEYCFFGSRVDIKKRAANATLNTLRLLLSGKIEKTENIS
ncbi:MAG: competence/damage-inducible protein A [Candidatus Scalindua sp.]|jgi:nicotinamide-nucleotide amidase|nr:competence/damage-inducible protein A [Candidatus Scalindua sp.]MBT5306592.1 competence/damage-inducible protein A [Candidatus Scalindua sp.]MBT6048608.1 competence/damage-inducible protein A [Candidatus Scalindua sp.]MBT6226389.1 competence/damage-inducible protein A [Candidatus Scalindua sp.]MBT6562036.1 competence/damage-inducible protein A [Candidatus Scalindua sp.]